MTARGSQQSIPQVSLIVCLSLAFFFSGFFVFLTPLPLVYVALKGLHESWRRCLIANLLMIGLFYALLVPLLHSFYQDNPKLVWLLPIPGLGFFPDFGLLAVTIYGLSYFCFFAAISLIIAALLRNPKAQITELAKNVGKLLVVLLGSYLLISFLLFDSPVTPLLQGFSQGLEIELNSPQLAISGIPPEIIALMKKEQAVLAEAMTYLLPAFIICTTLFIILFNTVIARRIFFHVTPIPPDDSARSPSMNCWRYPFELVWLVIASLALYFVNDLALGLNKPLNYLTLNSLLVLFFLYLFQGLGIVSFYMEKRQVGPVLRAFSYFSLFFLFFPVGVACLMVLGIFDSWFNFRKLN